MAINSELQKKLNYACNRERDAIQELAALQLQRKKLTQYINGVLAKQYVYDEVRFRFSLKQIKKINSKIQELKNKNHDK